jgi:hypothetical protein
LISLTSGGHGSTFLTFRIRKMVYSLPDRGEYQ